MGMYAFGRKASLKSLIFGLILLFFDVGVIIFVYGYISGISLGGEQFIITSEGLKGLIIAMLGIMAFGFVSGYEIGKYVEEVYVKRNEKQA
ncbi:MAG: hypothetical protein QHH18_03210 [Candidatus Bathyarchaeota archaeon]|jgi:hypothetical protein|nr:hypothetical protein [Candidatus Bathyarchaeota archaeon A05DMB-5]MDH7557601.1 hypothetical protein [Candidatus Bathyarchaeota archaeon]